MVITPLYQLLYIIYIQQRQLTHRSPKLVVKQKKKSNSRPFQEMSYAGPPFFFCVGLRRFLLMC